MGAREELLASARSLSADGATSFSPADLIRAARLAGCTYPESTLRTFIVGPMCLNSPDNHAVQYGDLVRVRHGRYRLATSSDSSSTPLVPISGPSATTAEASTSQPWFWEGNVQAALVRHLASEGWHVRRVADTASREHGVDIVADLDGAELLVEVKGYPSATYTSGERLGEKKATPQPLHARQSYSHALLSAMLLRDASRDARVVIAFPDFETYRNLAQRTARALSLADVEVWIVTETGDVRPVGGADATGVS